MFLLAALIRRDEIRAPGHLIEREYNSAIFARAFYFEGDEDVELWRRNNALATRDQFPLLEPPLTEYLVSLIYRIMDQEELWYARYLTGLFWLIGGIFLFKTVRILTTIDAALFALGYYLFTPWGIIISRSFQPDSLMMMMFLISLYSIVLYFERISWRNLLLAGTLAGLTLLLRPLVLFSLFGAFIALSISKHGMSRRLFSPQTIIFMFLSIVSPLAFYGYEIYITGSLQGQADLSFRPYLLTRWAFWTGWFDNTLQVVGPTFLLLAILGYILLRRETSRYLVAGLVVGYFIFGLFFTYHIHTHPYYQIQIFPLVSICMAPILVEIASSVKKNAGNYWWFSLSTILLIAIYSSWQDVRSTLYTPVFEDPSLAGKIGEEVSHSPHTVFVAYHYGMPLEYYGEFGGAPWPVRIDDHFYRRPDAKEESVQERLEGLGFIPEYFIITNFDLFHRHHQDLQAYLEENCKLLVQTDQYLIYDSCQNPSSIEALPATSITWSRN
jgi:hypothetical protein